MTRKDYVLLAEALSGTRPRDRGTDVAAWMAAQWRADLNAVADALARDNYRFDRTRFLMACGVEPQPQEVQK
jgi:hypothetical protein